MGSMHLLPVSITTNIFNKKKTILQQKNARYWILPERNWIMNLLIYLIICSIKTELHLPVIYFYLSYTSFLINST